jgi:mannitol 2-dehydrogenase
MNETSKVTLTAANLGALPDRVARPGYDRSKIDIGIVHFGVGGFHRAHQAMYLDQLMNRGLALDWGICGVGVLPADARMRDALLRQDGLYTLVVKHPNGDLDARVIGSLVRYLFGPDQPEEILDTLTNERIRIVSLTITEGGYNVDPAKPFDSSNSKIIDEMQPNDPPKTAFGFIVEALRRRREKGIEPFTVLSCDNIQGNGDIARFSVAGFAELKDPDLGAWIRKNVSFPNSMVDRITPVTTPHDIEILEAGFGICDSWPVVCEPFAQWIIQDTFPAGRPLWEECGVQLVEDVEPYELMKLRLLNASHQALAYAGYLAGYRDVADAATDPVFVEFLKAYMNREARPTLAPVPGIDLDEYIATLLERFANTTVGDTIARLAAAASDRIPKWVLPVIRANLSSGGEILRSVAIVASWARYAEGIDESGEPITIDDTLRDELIDRAKLQTNHDLAFVQNARIFGNLSENKEFARVYRKLLLSLHEVGARRTLENINNL